MFRHTAFFQGTHKSGKFSAVMLHNFVPAERSFDNLKLKVFIEVEFPGKSLLGLMKHQSMFYRSVNKKNKAKGDNSCHEFQFVKFCCFELSFAIIQGFSIPNHSLSCFIHYFASLISILVDFTQAVPWFETCNFNRPDKQSTTPFFHGKISRLIVTHVNALKKAFSDLF